MSNRKILIIEDNPMNLELATDLLEMAGFDVFAAETAEEGIKLAAVEQLDLILMDIALPGMDGLDAAAVLKQDPNTNHIPIVALTAHAMKGDEAKALAAGCIGYITKPLDTREFGSMVTRLLETART